MNDNDVMNGKAAAVYMDTTEGTLSTWRYLGKGPRYYKVGRRVVYRRSDLDAWLEAHAVTPDSAA